MSEALNGLEDFPNELHVLMKFHMQIGRWPQDSGELCAYEECEGIPLNITNYPMVFSGDPFSSKLKIQLLKIDEKLEKSVPFGELEFGVSIQKGQLVEEAVNAKFKSYFCAYRKY